MSLGEMLVILVVALLAFGPDKLPSLAKNIARVIEKLQAFKMQLQTEIDSTLKEQQYQENLRKAESVEKSIRNNTSPKQ